MEKESVLEEIANIIADQSDIEKERITPGASFVDDLELDSLDVVEMVMVMEERFGIEIPDEELENVRIVEDLIKYIKEKT